MDRRILCKIVCGEEEEGYDAESGDLITAVLRPGNAHASNVLLKILKRIIKRLKKDLYHFC